MKKNALLIASGLLLIMPVVYLLKIYSSLPPVIPTHFNLSGKPDGFGEKTSLIRTIALVSVTGIVSCLLLVFMPRIDPKRRGKPDNGQFLKPVLLTASVIGVTEIAVMYGTVNGQLVLGKIIGIVVGIAICIFGNLMYNVKPNYFFGIRVPWTLENEDNWRATHHMAGKLWFFGGLLIAAGSLLMPALFQRDMLVVSLLLFAFVPITYSFIYFRRHPENN